MSRRATDEQALLREVRSWMDATADRLEALESEAQELRHRLERTKSYRRVAGKEDAEDEATFDLAGTLGAMFEDDVDTMLWYLRASARGERAGPGNYPAPRRLEPASESP